MTISRPIIAAAVLLSVAACNKSSDSTSGAADSGGASLKAAVAAGSCTVQVGKTCFDYPGSAYTAAGVPAACTRINGTYSAAACPTADRVGSCEIYVGQPTRQTVRYYTVGFTTARAQAGCAGQSGVFTPN